MRIREIVVTAAFGLLGSFLGLFSTRLYDYMWKPFFLDYYMLRLREAMRHLKMRHNDVKVQVTKAELELKTCIDEVKWWLDEVKSIEDEVIDIEKEYFWWRSNYGAISSCIFFYERYKLGYKVVTERREVSKLHGQHTFKDVATKLPPAAQVLPSTPRVRDMYFNQNQILHYLQEAEVKMIGIWGMGGVGKTTLLKLINNYFTYSEFRLFDHVIFVVASKNLEELQKKILKSFGLPSEKDDDINSRATLLINFFKEKKALLLLDDLWEYVDLVGLGIPLGQGNCKVVFTTRSFFVCKLMKADRKLEVKCLNRYDAWSLFEEIVGENIEVDPSIGPLAEEIAEECHGLPLALVTIGKTMSTKGTWREWYDARHLLRSSRHYEILGMPNEIFSILEFSYLNLQNDQMRECFLSCCMWPEDWKISKHDLIIYWMGLDLIDGYVEINEAYDRGHAIIEGLIGVCLLEHCVTRNGESCVKMHDMLRDLALCIASDHGENKNRWVVQANIGLKECMAEKWEGPHRISLMFNDIESLPEQCLECPNLSVLTLHNNRSLEHIPPELFYCFKSLTYLDLGRSNIKELPVAVGELVKLKFLNLEYTKIEDLPDELCKLVNLKYLLLGHTPTMKPIPWKLIPCLSKLKVLDLFYSSAGIEMESQGGFEVLEQMDGRLMGLGISIDTILALRRLSMFSTISIMKILVENLEGTRSLELLSPDLFGSKPTADSLEVLHIINCGSLNMLVVNSLQPNGIPRPRSLQRLEKLSLRCLPLIENIVWNGVAPKEFLPRLRQVQIDKCGMVNDVSWVLLLPNLEDLSIRCCGRLEMVVRDAEDGRHGGGAEDRVQEPIVTFPKLRTLHLHMLPTLRDICRLTIRFRSLEQIFVTSCPNLRRLPFHTQNIPIKLQSIQGEVGWWDRLVWEHDITRLLLQGRFQESNTDA